MVGKKTKKKSKTDRQFENLKRSMRSYIKEAVEGGLTKFDYRLTKVDRRLSVLEKDLGTVLGKDYSTSKEQKIVGRQPPIQPYGAGVPYVMVPLLPPPYTGGAPAVQPFIAQECADNPAVLSQIYNYYYCIAMKTLSDYFERTPELKRLFSMLPEKDKS